MSDLKITVDQLKNYLGTGLECKDYGRLISVRDWIGWCGEFKDKTGSVNIPLSAIQPICYRLSDLDKEIDIDRHVFNPLIRLSNSNAETFDFIEKLGPNFSESFDIGKAPYLLVKSLFEWHFWPFGDEYFEQGLVIDKRKISGK